MFLLCPIPIHIIIIPMVLSLIPTDVYIFILWLLPTHLVYLCFFVSLCRRFFYMCNTYVFAWFPAINYDY